MAEKAQVSTQEAEVLANAALNGIRQTSVPIEEEMEVLWHRMADGRFKLTIYARRKVAAE